VNEKAIKLREEHGGEWGEHPDYPHEDWSVDAVNNDTRLGYWEWVADMLEARDGDGAGQYEDAESAGLPKPPVRTEFLRVGNLVFWSDPLHSVASGHYRIEEINAEGFKIYEEETGDVRTVAGHELELVGKHEAPSTYLVGEYVWWEGGEGSGVYKVAWTNGRPYSLVNKAGDEIGATESELHPTKAGPDKDGNVVYERIQPEDDQAELRAERDRLVEQLQAAGGRGVELANEIDELNKQLGEGEEEESEDEEIEECQHAPDWHSLTLAADLLPGEQIVDMNCTHCGISGSLRLDLDEIQWPEEA